MPDSSSSSSIPCAIVVGPQTLVCTKDSPGLDVSYTAAGFPSGGSYQWSVEALTNHPLAVALVSSSGASATIHALADKKSTDLLDQFLKVRWTKNDQIIERSIAITVAQPIFLLVVNGGTSQANNLKVTRTLTYKLQDQFSNDVHEICSYTNAYGQTNNSRVVNLLVSEQLVVDHKLPPTAQNPEPIWNIGVSDNGRFSDTHSVPIDTEYRLFQNIIVHIRPWSSNDAGFGCLVHQFIIEVYLQQENPELIFIFNDAGGGINGSVVPEQ